MQVTKEEFEALIKNYDGPGGLYSHEIGFTTPSSTIYCDFGIAPTMPPGIARIQACMVAEHIDPNPYDKNSCDKYHIYKTFK